MRDVTVLMSAYKAVRTLGEAIDSILGQTHTALRLVVYDDASGDGTAELLASYDDPRLDARILKENRGLTRNLAEGVQQCETPYLARMDADDIALPGRLAAQVAHMEAHADIDVLGTSVFFFDNDGLEILGRQPEHHDEIALQLFFGFTMMHPTIMMRTSALRAGNWNYDPQFRYSQDFDLWSRMLPHHRFANLQEPLLKLREHPDKISRAKRGPQQELSTRIRARQIKRVLPEASTADIETFAAAARGDLPETLTELRRLENFLHQLTTGNATRGVYPEKPFEMAAADWFRMLCRRMMHAGHPAGLVYMMSALRSSAPPEGLRARLSFATLTALSGVGLAGRR